MGVTRRDVLHLAASGQRRCGAGLCPFNQSPKRGGVFAWR